MLIWLYIIFAVLILLLLALAVLSVVCISIITVPKLHSLEREFQLMPSIRPVYDELESTASHFEFTTSRGYTLRGEVIPSGKNALFADGKPRAVILEHGYTFDRYDMLPYAEIYHKLGFALVMYDHRFHGESDKVFCSMGYYEGMDAVEISNHVRRMMPADTVWGMHGESMGSVALMTAVPELPWLSFCCEDCGFTTLREEISASIIYRASLPPHPLTETSCILLKLWRGFSAGQLKPIDSVKNIKIPMLFLHGGEDRYVPSEMVHRLYEAKPGNEKMLKVFDGVPHARSCIMHHEEYRKTLTEFLEKYGII